jgi:hypothetical protein
MEMHEQTRWYRDEYRIRFDAALRRFETAQERLTALSDRLECQVRRTDDLIEREGARLDRVREALISGGGRGAGRSAATPRERSRVRGAHGG